MHLIDGGKDMIKILHTADLHLRDKNIEDAAKCCDLLIDSARNECVEIIVIAADIFDSRDIKVESPAAKLAIKTASALADIAPVVIITGTPSHDGLAPEILQYAKGFFQIFVATQPTQIAFDGENLYQYRNNGFVPGIDAVITLIPQPTKQYFQTNADIQNGNIEISQAMNAIFAGFGAQAQAYDCPHILVGHWNVAGSKLPTGQTLTGNDIDISVDQMMLCNPDLICLGHIHMHQQLGDRSFYPGSLYPLTWGELEEKGFYIHTLEGRNLVESLFIKTPVKKLARMEFDLTDEFSEYLSLNDRLVKEDYESKVNGAFVRIDITVWQDKAGEVDKEAIREFCLDAGAIDADIRIHRIPRQTVRSESVLKVQSLREKLVAMAAIKEETVPETILIKADGLENGPADDVIGRAA
jgi:DNA repair exonuclease SbcCD nuclease subunit